jgi:hypothetical protein
MNRLEDVDVSGVHLVGSPANHRPFALFKSTEEPESMKLTPAEFKKRIATQVEGEIDDEKLNALAKAIGIELVKEAPKPKVAKQDPPKDEDAPDEDDGALQKGIDAKALERIIAKANQPLLDKIEQLEKAAESRARGELAKRAKVLKAAGYELADDVTEAEIAALEKAHERVVKAAERLGLEKAFGSAEAEEPTSGVLALQKAIDTQVTEILGRTPVSDVEKAQTKRMIYRANPGMLTAIVRAERAQRDLAAAS